MTLRGTSGELIDGFLNIKINLTKESIDREAKRFMKYLSDNKIDATGFSDEQIERLYLLFLEKFGFGG